MKNVHFKMIEKSNLTIQKKLSVLPETNMTPENRPSKKGNIPKGKNRIPTIHFQVRFVSFREGSSWGENPTCNCLLPQGPPTEKKLLADGKPNLKGIKPGFARL